MKKYIPLFVIIALLIVAIILSIKLNSHESAPLSQPIEENTPENESSDAQLQLIETENVGYFEQFRDERESVRALELQYIDEVITTGANDDETLAEANAMKLSIVENMEKEFAIENLIRAKGFSDAAVTLKSGSLNIVVDCKSLSSEQVAQILDIAIRESGESADNIKIIPGQG